MKLKKYRVLAAALCAAFLLCGITTTAYAGGGEEWEDGTGGPEWEWNCQESCSLKNTQNSLSIIVQFADCNRCNCSSHIFGILSSSP